MYNADQLNELLVTELHDIAEPLEISQYRKLDKASLIQKILESQAIMNTKSKTEGATSPNGNASSRPIWSKQPIRLRRQFPPVRPIRLLPKKESM